MYYAHSTRLFDAPFYLLKSEEGLVATWFDEGPYRTALENLDALITAEPFEEEVRWLQAYEKGHPPVDTPPLAPAGTSFQRSVWQAASQIPFGAFTTYGDLARTLDKPRASRAVGGALGKNPIPLFIPCHRIVGGTGKLTGFSAEGGIHLKAKLLRHEGLNTKGDQALDLRTDHPQRFRSSR